jgi:hypothetical protein
MKIISLLSLAIVCFGCGYGSKTTPTPQPGVAPSIAQLSPDTAKAASPGFTLTVNGSGFSNNAVVNWNGTAQTTAYVTANQLTAPIAAADIATPGTAKVSVTNPATAGSGGAYGSGGTTSATSTAVDFTIN